MKTKPRKPGPIPQIKLNTLRDVRAEMARLYREWRGGKLASDEMTKGTYTLKELRGAVEAELLVDIQERLATLAEHEVGRG